MKILTFSYDDGTMQDVRLAALFHKYGMKATFNLNSGLFGHEKELIRCDVPVRWDQVQATDVKYIYEGHEVAAHTLTHPSLPQQTDEEIIRQVENDRLALSELCGYEVVGFAYPGGGQNYTDHVTQLIRENTGVRYARTIRPVHTSADGDTIFVMSTAEVECNPDALGCLATEVMGRAINRAATMAEPAYGLPSAKTFA